MPICKNCCKEFPTKILHNDEIFYLGSRKFCTECSPIGEHNRRSYIIKTKNNEHFCVRCKEIKDKKEFYKRKNGKELSYCIKCQKQVKEIKLQENLERIIEKYGGECADCKGIFPFSVYDFYKKGKIYNIGSFKNMKFSRINNELEGYEMLCKNCVEIRKWAKS